MFLCRSDMSCYVAFTFSPSGDGSEEIKSLGQDMMGQDMMGWDMMGWDMIG